MSNTADQGIVAQGLSAWSPMPKHLACWITDFSFSVIAQNTGSDLLRTYISFCHVEEVYWSCINFKDHFFLSFWCTEEANG